MYTSIQISALSLAQKFTQNFTFFSNSNNHLTEQTFEIGPSLKITRNYRLFKWPRFKWEKVISWHKS